MIDSKIDLKIAIFEIKSDKTQKYLTISEDTHDFKMTI